MNFAIYLLRERIRELRALFERPDIGPSEVIEIRREIIDLSAAISILNRPTALARSADVQRELSGLVSAAMLESREDELPSLRVDQLQDQQQQAAG